MSNETPLTLVQLARQRLLREEALVMSTLEDLPVELLPGIFDEALNNNQTNIVRAMVPSWPFPCLHAGGLMKIPCLETVKALLDGLDLLIAQNLYPSSRRSKLKVLDFIYEHDDFWSIKTGCNESYLLPQIIQEKQSQEIYSISGERKRFIILTDLEYMKTGFSPCDRYLLHWAQRQKFSIHLCCRKLKMLDSPVFTTLEILKIIHLDCLLELAMNHCWLEVTTQLFPYLGQMSNLHTFVLEGNHKGTSTSEQQKWLRRLLSLFSQLPNLRNLHISGVHFLKGCIEDWIRYVRMPLRSLSITDCQFIRSDLDFLGWCLNIGQLKHLSLSSTVLSDLCPTVLGVLFLRISGTLQTLELEECEIDDSHFNAILPGLSQCFQLTQVNFYDNNISLCVLKNLLRHTAKLSNLQYELYPAPLECYEESRILKDKFQEICPELLDILKAQRQPKEFYFSTRLCLDCFGFCCYDGEARLCPCLQVE